MILLVGLTLKKLERPLGYVNENGFKSLGHVVSPPSYVIIYCIKGLAPLKTSLSLPEKNRGRVRPPYLLSLLDLHDSHHFFGCRQPYMVILVDCNRSIEILSYSFSSVMAVPAK